MKRRVAALISSFAIAGASLFGLAGPAQAQDPTGPFALGCHADGVTLPSGARLSEFSSYALFADDRIYSCQRDPEWRWVLRETCPAGTAPQVMLGPTPFLPGGWYLISSLCQPTS